MTTQHSLIIKRLRKGWCTGLQALYDTGSMKLATRVSELRRDGYTVQDKWVEHNGKRFKSYRIAK